MAWSHLPTSLLPPGLIVEQVRVGSDEIVILARSRQLWAACSGLRPPFGAGSQPL